jgi:hypothetical protein
VRVFGRLVRQFVRKVTGHFQHEISEVPTLEQIRHVILNMPATTSNGATGR